MNRSPRRSLAVLAVTPAILVLVALSSPGVATAEVQAQAKTTTTAKSDSSKSDSAKSGKGTTTTTKADSAKSGKGTTTTTESGGGKSGGSTTTTTGKSPAAGASITAYGVAIKGGPELAAKPVVTVSACPADETGKLPSIEAAPMLTTGLANVRTDCTSQGGSNVVRSRSDVSALALTFASGPITAETVTAACVATSEGTQGGVTITGLHVGEKAVTTADVAPNTALTQLAKGNSGTVNEQVRTGDKLTVNALHLKLGATDVVVGHVECVLGLAAAGPGATPTTGPVHSDKPAAPPVSGKGKKGLANTGARLSPSLVLAVGALLAGIALRVGSDGLLVLVPGGRARLRRRLAIANQVHRPARSWTPRDPTD